MLTISPITNVNNTINHRTNKLAFTSGVRINKGADVINYTTGSQNEGKLIPDFLGAIKQSPFFYETFMERQASIEAGLDAGQNKINIVA